MTMGQVWVVAGLHFQMIRLLLLFGWVRLIARREIHAIKLNQIDRTVLWWTLSSVLVSTILWQTSDAFVNRLGLAYNVLGMYFLIRCLLRDLDDVENAFRLTAILIVPLAAAMLMERITGRNVFAIFGGVHEITQIRDGVLRCQGPFLHPILAGTFGGALLPFFVALWQRGRNRITAAGGMLASTVIVITSGSSGPIMTYGAAVIGLGMWYFRRHLRTVRWGLVIVLIALQIVMKAPVWFLIARVDVLSGSTGYHRAALIDRAVANLGDWWLIGIKSTEKWGADLHGDITNQYVWEGINGGLITLVLFIMIIVRSFRTVGNAMTVLSNQPLWKRRYVWALGAALFADAVTFMSVQYFDQNSERWFLLLAMISTVSTVIALRPKVSELPLYRLRSAPTAETPITL